MSDNSAAQGGSAALHGKNGADPSGNTEAFRAFTERAFTESAPPERATAKTPLIIAAAAVAVLLIAVVVWLLS